MSQLDTDKELAAQGRSQETESFVRTVKAATRRKYTPEEKIRIVLLTDSLAWPAFALIALLILKPFLWKLGSLLETIRYRGLELNFRRTVQDAAERVESLVADDEATVEDSLPGTLDPDPRITILKSWAAVETAIEDGARAHRQELGQADRMSTRRRVEILRQARVIDHELAAVLNDMGTVRNLIAHGGDIPLTQIHRRDDYAAAERAIGAREGDGPGTIWGRGGPVSVFSCRGETL